MLVRMSNLRRDAVVNRSRLVEAARDVFSERGLRVPLEVIADRAGVGIATLYRRFPTRDALIEAAFRERLEAYIEAADAALADADVARGLGQYIERICSLQASDRGLQEILTRTFAHAPGLEERRLRGYERSVALIERAKEQGVLRQDFVPEDLILLLLANAGVIAGTRVDAPGAWKRFAALMLDAFRVTAPSPLPPPPAPRAMLRAMRRLAR
jgi:AcrR family transcriptional regulator